jgi:tRNA U34 5-methylaminomethyl-2-thiouridine-forming methyltransferase MnmC
MLKRELLVTADGSHTLFLPDLKEQYHSVNGAYAESMTIYIEAGLHVAAANKSRLNIFEMGMGTGLNALLSLEYAIKRKTIIHYTCVEAYPLPLPLAESLNHADFVALDGSREYLIALHRAEPFRVVPIAECFFLDKRIEDMLVFEPEASFYDVIYFDAFAPKIQEELWSEEVFEKLFYACVPGAILLTYSCAGRVKRNLKAAGFELELLPGPAGKREFIRATKPSI